MPYYNDQMVTAMKAASTCAGGKYEYLEQAVEIQNRNITDHSGGVCVGLTCLFLFYGTKNTSMKKLHGYQIVWSEAERLQAMYEAKSGDDHKVDLAIGSDASQGLIDAWNKVGLRFTAGECSLKMKEIPDLIGFLSKQDGCYQIVLNGEHAIAVYVNGNDCRFFDPNCGIIHVKGKDKLGTVLRGYFTHPIITAAYQMRDKATHMVEAYRLKKN